MPSSSKAQQRFFGVVKAMQKGDIPKKGGAGKLAKSMSKDDVDDFASTKHKGLPNKVKREMRVKNLIKKMVREELKEMQLDEKCQKGYMTHPTRKTKKMFGKQYRNCVKAEGKIEEGSDTFVNILNKFGFKKGARDWGGHQFFVHKSKDLYATYNPNGRSLVIEPKRGGKPVFDSDRSNFSIRALLSYLQSPKNKFVSTEGKLSEAISGADRKILFILVREIVRNLKPKIKNFDVNNKSHMNKVGSSILAIIRAMTYSPDNVNYKNFKKYFPKNFNNKLVQKKLKQFHSQNDKVQVTLVTQAIKNELSEGKLNEKVQKYVVGLDNGEVISGDKAVSEKKAHQIMTRISDRSNGWVNPFMIGVEAWNGTHPKSKGKPHKMNKKKITVKEGTCGYGVNGQLGEEPAGPHLIKKKKIKESRVAKTILQQLGGNKFIAMTGAKNLGSTNKSLQFKIGRNSKSISHVIITLKSSDLYEMEFIRIRGTKRTVVKKVKGVYADQLQTMFTKYTGMNTRL